MNRRVLAVVALGMAVVLVGCAAESPILTQPTPLATKSEDPVTAAKAAFLAYVAVSNAVSIDDQASIDAALALTAPPLRDIDAEFYKDLQDAGWKIEGDIRITSLEPVEAQSTDSKVVLKVCQDLSRIRYINSRGERGTMKNQPMTESRYTDVTLANGEWFVTNAKLDESNPEC